MKAHHMTRAFIADLYKALADDDDVARLHLYGEVLQAAKAVLDASPAVPMPYPLDLVVFALQGAYADLQDKRHVWRARGLR